MALEAVKKVKEQTMNDFDLKANQYGKAIVDGVEYALLQAPYIDKIPGSPRVGYLATGFSRQAMNSDGKFCDIFGETVTLAWDCDEWFNDPSALDGEFDCDWELDAKICK